MKKVTGVRFKKSGKIYFFEIGEFNLEKGMHVIVDTAMGEEYGEIVIPYKEIKDEDVNEPLKKVVRIITDKDKKMYEHPTIKPLELIRRLIRNSSKENDIVLDCFLGSGTTAVACILENRKYIGFEINKKYFDIANKRISEINKDGD